MKPTYFKKNRSAGRWIDLDRFGYFSDLNYARDSRPTTLKNESFVFQKELLGVGCIWIDFDIPI